MSTAVPICARVNCCEDCTFSNPHAMTCNHPSRVAERRRHPLHDATEEIMPYYDDFPPPWCDLRDAPVLVVLDTRKP